MHIRRAFVIGTLLSAVPASLLAAPLSLCSTDEETIFSCHTKRKTYEICASKDLSATSGYMQYRAGSNGKAEFVFPSQRLVPVGHFKFRLLARGAQLTFQNGGFTYEVVEPLIGKTTIWVSQGNGATQAAQECQNFTDSLTLTTTQNRFKSLGIYE
jgi:hypothetical protein